MINNSILKLSTAGALALAMSTTVSAYELTKDFGEAIREMCRWLDAHPGEFFVINLYKSSDDNSNLDSNNLMGNLMNDPAVAPHLIQFKPDLTVGEMRGKILFMKRDGLSWNSPYATVLDRWYETYNLLSGYELRGRVYPTKPGTVNRYDRRETYLLVQDKGNIRNAGDQKQREAKQIFDFLSTWRPTTCNNMVWTFNFASAYNATISTSSSYAETAESINPYFLECVNNSGGPVGMIMMDFVGADQHSGFAGASRTYTTQGATLTKAIIDQNFKYIDDLVSRQVNGIRFVDKFWSGVLWDQMFYGNNIFADVNGATAATTVVYPTVRKADVVSAGIQVIGPDKKAAPLDLTAGDITTSIDRVDIDDDSEAVYYNLQGVRVAGSGHGVYIVRKSDKTYKLAR